MARRSAHASGGYHAHDQCAIGAPRVAAAVCSFENLVKSLHWIHLGKSACLLEATKQVITLRVDVGGNVVCDLSRRPADPDLCVVGHRSNPNPTSVGFRQVRLPEANVMALSRVVPDWLLEGKVLFASP